MTDSYPKQRLNRLVGLVYGLTPQPSEEGLAWYQRPAPLALCVLLLTAAVNVIFW